MREDEGSVEFGCARNVEVGVIHDVVEMNHSQLERGG